MRERTLELFLSQFVWRRLFVDIQRRFSWFLPRVDTDQSAEDRCATGNDDNGRLESISTSTFYSYCSKMLDDTFASKVVRLFCNSRHSKWLLKLRPGFFEELIEGTISLLVDIPHLRRNRPEN